MASTEKLHTQIWHKLNDAVANGLDLYKVAKENKLIPKGFTKELYQCRGGVLMGNVAERIIESPELATKFNITLDTEEFIRGI